MAPHVAYTDDICQLTEKIKGFTVLYRRWVVERTFA